MLETIRSLLSMVTDPEGVQHWTATLEALLSSESRTAPAEWLDRHAGQLDYNFLLALIDILQQRLYQTSVESTQELFYLDPLIILLLLRYSNLDEFLPRQLTEIGKVLEEEAVGPCSSSGNPRDVYKCLFNYRGCCLAEHGEYPASIEHFSITLSLDPHFAPAYCNRARAYLEMNHFDEAWKDCETVQSFDPQYSVGQATSQLVETLRRLKQNRVGTAAELAQEHGILELLRRYDRPLKPKEQIFAHYRQLNPLEMPDEPGSDATPDELNHLGVVRVRSGDYKDALEAFDRTLVADPNYLKAYYNRAKVYVLLSDYAKAVADYAAIVERDPQDTQAKRYLAEAQTYLQRQQQQQSGTDPLAGEAPRQTAIEDEEGEDVLEDSRELLEGADHFSRLLHQHQQALEILNRFDVASIQAQASLPARRRLQQAMIKERQGELVDAFHYYHETLAMLSRTRYSSLLISCLEGFGRCLHARNAFQEAYSCWKQALAMAHEKGDPIAEERLCHSLGQLEEQVLHLKQAQEWYQKAEALARTYENWGGVFGALTRLAVLMAKQEQFDEQQRLEAVCRQLEDEYGEIVYAGPNALHRPQIIAQARELLGLEEIIHSEADLETAKKLRQHATNLRKSGHLEESLSPYCSALAYYIRLDYPIGMLDCLNGLGVSYQKLAEALVKQERSAFFTNFRAKAKEEALLEADLIAAAGIIDIASIQVYNLFYKRADELAERSRVCHRWTLELCKELDDIAGQANQIGNLAGIEDSLGNLDTAYRYHRWALQWHLQTKEWEDARIDLINLAYIEERLGDEEAGAIKRSKAEELGHAG